MFKKNTTKHIENNNYFNLLLANLNRYFSSFENVRFSSGLKSLNINGKVKFQQMITLKLESRSWISFGSGEQPNQIEISAIGVPLINQNNGEGSFLMKLMLNFMKETLGFVPICFLECTGNIESSDFLLINSIQNQTRFFRKFAFRVKNRKHYPHYVSMEADFSNIDYSDLFWNKKD